jgi:hypothetical protein
MQLPSFPQFDEVTTMPTTIVETNQNNKLLFNMGVSNKDSISIYNLEIAFGTSFATLVLIIVIMAFVIWHQRRHIQRLRVYFNGHEELRPIFNRGHQQLENGENNAIGNDNIRLHQNQDLTNLIDLMFPRDLTAGNHLRNITALRAFHKSQRENLKAYATRQEQLFQNPN